MLCFYLHPIFFSSATMNIGAVAAMREIKSAISVARHVLDNTQHSLIVGERATEFAERMGFKRETLTTNVSKSMWTKWKADNCQPNFWMVGQFFSHQEDCINLPSSKIIA